jgi:hypothetical protein
MAIRSCQYCGLKIDVNASLKKRFCSDSHKMRWHRILKKGFQLAMVERSLSALSKRLVTMGYDENQDDFLIHKKEHGDNLSKDCWYIMLKGEHLRLWKKAHKLK